MISRYVLEVGLAAFVGGLHVGSERKKVRQQGRFVGFWFEQLCERLLVPFVEMGNIESIWGVNHNLCFVC